MLKEIIESGKVVIDLDEYVELIEKQFAYEMIMDTLFPDARLAWNDRGLTFDSDSLNNLLRVIEGRRYAKRMSHLQKEKETKREE